MAQQGAQLAGCPLSQTLVTPARLSQIFHGERVAYNLMEGADVARFLAHPERQRVLDHLGNLQ